MDTIGKRLKYAQEKKGLTNKELAQKMGKNSPSTIISWQNDTTEITVSQLKELAVILDVSVSFLMNGEEATKVVTKPTEEYVLMKKDELIGMQGEIIELKDELIKYQRKEIEELRQKEENLKNIEVVRTDA